MKLLESINFICSSMSIYATSKQYFIWLNRAMFKQVLIDLKEKVYNAGAAGGERFDPKLYFGEDKFVYADPMGFTYTFQVTNIFMITVQ